MDRLLFFLLILSCLFTGCCRDPSCSYGFLGPKEFVEDSYKIREGKYAILEMKGCQKQELCEETLEEFEDIVKESDVFNVVLYHPTRTDLKENVKDANKSLEGFVIRNDYLACPGISPICTKGLTLEQLRQAVEKEFRKHYDKEVEIFLSYKFRGKNKVDIIGGDTQKSSVYVNGKLRLYDLLADIKVDDSINYYNSYVLRDNKMLPVDMYKLVIKGDMSQNIIMYGGDKVYLSKVFPRILVTGEVHTPISVRTGGGGFVSLPDVLTEAKGVLYSANKCSILVFRPEVPHPKAYMLTFDHLLCLPREALLLMPGDTVYVSEKSLSKWNRFMLQLLPTMHVIQAGNSVYRILK